MEIKIKKIGNRQGTIGWLASGLEAGEITIGEGSLKSNGNHGLWLEGPDNFKQFLAAFNKYGHDGQAPYDPFRYRVAEDCDREHIWTDAAWAVVMQIAQDWCDEMNTNIENEEAHGFTIRRVEVEPA